VPPSQTVSERRGSDFTRLGPEARTEEQQKSTSFTSDDQIRLEPPSFQSSREMVRTRAGTPTNPSGGTRPSADAARRLDNDAGGTDEVEVSSSVAVVAAGAGDPDDDPDDNDEDGSLTDDASGNQDDGGERGERRDESRGGDAGGERDGDDDRRDGQAPVAHQPPTRRPTRPSIATEHEHAAPAEEDSFESMTWWDALTPAQQRAMMRRFVVNPPAAATPVAAATPAAAPPVVVQARSSKEKRLSMEDFKGMPGESIEAWLSTVRQAVQRQAVLGGDTWTSAELYYGVTAHLKGNANKW